MQTHSNLRDLATAKVRVSVAGHEACPWKDIQAFCPSAYPESCKLIRNFCVQHSIKIPAINFKRWSDKRAKQTIDTVHIAVSSWAAKVATEYASHVGLKWDDNMEADEAFLKATIFFDGIFLFSNFYVIIHWI